MNWIISDDDDDHGRPQDFISRGGGTFSFKKVDDLFSLIHKTHYNIPRGGNKCPQNTGLTQVLAVTANTQNTLQHFQGQVLPPPLPLPAGAHDDDEATTEACF